MNAQDKQDMREVQDAKWRDLACSSREALKLLGYDITERCLPDEPAPCGASFAEHAAAHLATLAAVTAHHCGHLGPAFEPLIESVYDKATEEVSHW